MGQPTSLSSPFSPTRSSKLVLDESSLSEAQAKLRLSPGRFQFYASDASDDASGSYHEVASPRFLHDVEDAKLQGPPAGSNFRRPPETEMGLDKSHMASVIARLPKDDTDDDLSNGGCSINSVLDTRKPQKPRKPSFLAVARFSSFDNTSNAPDNVQYATGISSDRRKDGEEMGQAVQGDQSSPPSKVNKPLRIRLNVNRATILKDNRIPRDRHGKPQSTTRRTIWRQSLQSTPHRNPEKPLFKLPLDDPERPFPFPIPTVDKLPLLPKRTVHQPVKAKGQAADIDGVGRLFAHSKEKIMIWIKSRKVAFVSLSLYGPEHSGQVQSLSFWESESYMLRVGTRWTVIPIGNVSSHNQIASEPLPMEGAVNLLQINIVMPVLVLRAIALIGAAIQGPQLPILLPTVVKFGKTFFLFVVLAKLLTLKEIWLNMASRQNQGGNRAER